MPLITFINIPTILCISRHTFHKRWHAKYAVFRRERNYPCDETHETHCVSEKYRAPAELYESFKWCSHSDVTTSTGAGWAARGGRQSKSGVSGTRRSRRIKVCRKVCTRKGVLCIRRPFDPGTQVSCQRRRGKCLLCGGNSYRAKLSRNQLRRPRNHANTSAESCDLVAPLRVSFPSWPGFAGSR